MKINVEEIKRINENLLGFITIYVLRVERNETTPAYRIYRRYHEIHALHKHLKQIFLASFTGMRLPPFPTRKLLFQSDRSSQRKAKDLTSYFDDLLEIPFVANSSTMDEFILRIAKDEERLQSLIEQNPDFTPRVSFSGPLKINGVFVEDGESLRDELVDHIRSSFVFLSVHDGKCNTNFSNNTIYDEKINEIEFLQKLHQKLQCGIRKALHNELHDIMHKIQQDWTESILNQDWVPHRSDGNLLHSVKKGCLVYVVERTNAGWWLVTDPQFPGFFGYLPAAYLSIPIDQLESISCSEPWSVKHDYLKFQDDELSVAYGDTVTVLEKFVDGWWRCRAEDNQIGMVPCWVLMRPNKSVGSPVAYGDLCWAMGRRAIRGQSLKKRP